MSIKDVIFAVCETILKVALVAVVVVVIYRGANLAFEYGYRIFQEPPMSEGTGREINVTIPEGMSAKEMGELLYQKGLIRDTKLFYLQYLLSEFKEDLLPGEFTLSTAMTVEEMMEAMTIEPVGEETTQE